MTFTSYMIGANESKESWLPRQLDFSSPNPYKTVKTPTGLDKKSRFVDYNLALKFKTLREYGAYKTQGPGGKAIPITTPAIVLDYTNWLLKNNRRLKRAHGVSEELRVLNELKDTKGKVVRWFNKQMSRTGVVLLSPRYISLARTTVIPAPLALKFWVTTSAQVLRMDMSKLIPGLFDELTMLSKAFWDSAKNLVKKIPKGVGWLLNVLKWFAIVFGIGIGGLLILNIVQGVRPRLRA